MKQLRRAALVAGAALLLYAGHPPIDVGWAGLVALVPLLALARDLAGDDGRRVLGAAGWGLLAGVLFFGPLLLWLFRFGVAAWGLLIVLQSLYLAAWMALVTWYGVRPGRPVFAVAAWVALEAARATFPLGGFTWGQLAYTQHDGGLLLPAARTLGALGVSALAAAVAVAVEETMSRAVAAMPRARGAAAGEVPADLVFRAMRTPLVSALTVLVFAVLVPGSPPPASDARLDIAAVQGAEIRSTSAAGVTRESQDRIVRVAEQMLLATRPLASDPPMVTVWPENSLDADVTEPENEALRTTVNEALAVLDGGALLGNGFLNGPRPRTFFNAMLELQPGPRVGQRYLKRQLVPFGEYVPGRRWLGSFGPLQQIPSDGLPGHEPGVLDIAGASIGAVICFENTFPDLVHSQVRAGAEVLVVSTNNTSYGTTPMSRQHLAFSQLRAVETGRWVLHAGISGISGVIDPEGRVSQRTELFEEAIVRADLPLVDGLTPATRYGWLVAWLAWLLVAAGILWRVVRRTSSSP